MHGNISHTTRRGINNCFYSSPDQIDQSTSSQTHHHHPHQQMQASKQAPISGCERKTKQERRIKMKLNGYCTGGRRGEERRGSRIKEGKRHAAHLEIVPIEALGHQVRIRGNNALVAPVLGPSPSTSRAVLICSPRRGCPPVRSLPHSTGSVHAPRIGVGSFRFRPLSLPDAVLVITNSGGNVGCADQSGVAGMGIGHTHPSSSRSVESDDIERKKS